MSLDAMEREELDQLDKFGELISSAYRLSGEPPSRPAIDWINGQMDVPAELQSDEARRRFLEGLRTRMEEGLRKRTGASTLGGFIQDARERVGLNEAEASRQVGLMLPAYRQLESNRMPIWRAQAGAFASFCRALSLDSSVILRWASLQMGSGPAFGRLDVTGDTRTEVLASLAGEADADTFLEFDRWRQAFIDAWGSASEGHAPAGQ